jgi:hypothetical protein
MTDGTIKLRLRNVQYESPESDEASLSDSKQHRVDSEIRLSGEDGETYSIDYTEGDGEFDWIVVYRDTESAKEGIWKDVTSSAMWSRLVGDEVVIDVSARRHFVLEIRGTKCSVYCSATGFDSVTVEGTRPDIPENILTRAKKMAEREQFSVDAFPREKADHVSESGAPSSGVVEALKEVGAFFGATLILFVFVWPPWLLLLRDAAGSVVAGLLVSMAILLIRGVLLPHTERILVVLNAVIILAIYFVRWLS